jgi:hypothetical protein
MLNLLVGTKELLFTGLFPLIAEGKEVVDVLTIIVLVMSAVCFCVTLVPSDFSDRAFVSFPSFPVVAIVGASVTVGAASSRRTIWRRPATAP